MNKQEIFNRAVKGLASQGFQPSFNRATGNCSYRSPEGLKCAIGHIISDENYNPFIESRSVAADIVWTALNKEGIFDSEFGMYGFLCELQRAHDRAVQRCDKEEARPGIMKSNLERVAREFVLTLPDELK